MRGAFEDQGRLFSYISPEARVPANHPLRKIRELVRDVLGELNRSLSKLYASEGRPSIPPEQLLSALLLQVFYGIRSEWCRFALWAQALNYASGRLNRGVSHDGNSDTRPPSAEGRLVPESALHAASIYS